MLSAGCQRCAAIASRHGQAEPSDPCVASGARRGGRSVANSPDFEFARDAVARGEILPLAEVLRRLQTSHPGRVVEVELEYSDQRLTYEVELVTTDGRLIEVDMNAATGEIVKLDEED